DAAHEVGAGLADVVELPLLEPGALGDRAPGVLTVAADEPVERHRHVQNDVSHDLALLRLVPVELTVVEQHPEPSDGHRCSGVLEDGPQQDRLLTGDAPFRSDAASSA